MKIGVIIPDRNDRPRFLKNCLRMMAAQTMQPDIIEVVNDDFLKFDGDGYKEENNQPDITQRYRIGYDRLRGKDVDAILFIENDDWYHPDYIKTMILNWTYKGYPDLFGQNYTIYYHLKLFAWFTMRHETRSSAMNTLIKADLDFKWCPDNEAFTDTYLWNTIENRVIFTPDSHICMGMKHGIGLCGGKSHVDRLNRYEAPNGNPDYDKMFLKNVLDPESFEFYANYFNEPVGVQ